MFNKLIAVTIFLMLLTGCSTIQSIHSQSNFTEKHLVSALPMPEIKLEPTIVELTVRPVPLIRELNQRAHVQMTPSEIECVAQAVYYEARGEGLKGQAAVAYVILNRMAHEKFRPTTACGVVRESRTTRSGKRVCQFSWVCVHNGQQRRNPAAYSIARDIAIKVMRHEIDNPIRDSVFFRTRAVPPLSKNQYVATINNHYFYGI